MAAAPELVVSTPSLATLPLARTTFDMDFANDMLARALSVVDALEGSSGRNSGGKRAASPGARELLTDGPAASAAAALVDPAEFEVLLVLQTTFTDAAAVVQVAQSLDRPVLLWGWPEPRAGGRLRLNSLCGINLAAHALGRAGVAFDYLYLDPAAPHAASELAAALTRAARREVLPSAASREATGDVDIEAARAALDGLSGLRIGRLGAHPDGFDTCSYDDKLLEQQFGVKVQPETLDGVFERARNVDEARVQKLDAETRANLAGIDDMEAEPYVKSLALYAGMRDLADDAGYGALAVRCWPETFTEYGCAACGAMARLNQERLPATCEADVYGAVMTTLLGKLADAPALMVDLVDVDRAGDSAVFWHCGLAPLDMAAPGSQPRAALHSNRMKPLLNEFPLKAGQITIARLSQSRGVPKLVVGLAEMIEAPMSFTGTSGVLRFARPAGDVLDTVMREGLEHHYCFVYGDVRASLRGVARLLDMPLLELA